MVDKCTQASADLLCPLLRPFLLRPFLLSHFLLRHFLFPFIRPGWDSQSPPGRGDPSKEPKKKTWYHGRTNKNTGRRDGIVAGVPPFFSPGKPQSCSGRLC